MFKSLLRWELEALVHAVEPTVLISQRLSHQPPLPPYGGTNVKLTQGQQGLLTIGEEQERAEILLSVSCTVSNTASSQLWTRECADFPGQRPERGRTSWPGSTFISKRFLVATLFWQRAITNHFIAEALKSITEIQKFSISLPASVRRHHLSPCCV